MPGGTVTPLVSCSHITSIFSLNLLHHIHRYVISNDYMRRLGIPVLPCAFQTETLNISCFDIKLRTLYFVIHALLASESAANMSHQSLCITPVHSSAVTAALRNTASLALQGQLYTSNTFNCQ